MEELIKGRFKMEEIKEQLPGVLSSFSASLDNARIALYSEFISFMLESMSLKSNDSEKGRRKLGIKLQELGLRMLLIGSDTVVEKFLLWRALTKAGRAGDSAGAEAIFKVWAEVVIEMRRELVGDTGRGIGDVLDILT